MSRKHKILEIFIRFIPYIIIIAAGVLTYKEVIFSTGPAFQINDIEVIYFPKYYLMRLAFMRGEFPLWDPYVMLGQPFVFSMGMSMLYPLLLGFMSLSFLGPLLPRQLELFIIGHLLVSGITMYWSAKKSGLGRLGACAAGIVFQMAIINKDVIYSPGIVFGMPYIPLVITFGIILLSSKEPLLSKKNIISLLIFTISCTLLISTTYPTLIVYSYITFIIAIALYSIIRIDGRDWTGIIILFKKAVWIFIVPLLLNAIIIIPGYVTLMDSIRYNSVANKFGPLYIAHIWTLLFPGFANSIQPPIAYAGVITLLLAVYFCITKKNNRSSEEFLFVILAIFWFYYSVDGSFLEKGLSFLPIVKNVRIPQFGLIIYIYAISLLAGKGLERISNFRDYKFKLNKNWLFPFFIICMLMHSRDSFIEEIHKGFVFGNTITLLFGYVFALYLVFQYLITSNVLRIVLSKIIPIVIILEIFVSSPFFIYRSEAEELFPYKPKLDKFASDFPECFLSNNLYRVENFSEYTIANYYFNRFSAYGYYAQGTQPARYYYLWDRFGRQGPRYEKWWVYDIKNKRIIPIPLDSKLYDLAGVNYFYLPEYEWLFIDYEKSGQGEWVEAELEKSVLVYGIGIYNPPNTAGGPDPSNKRRILEATVVLNGEDELNIKIVDEEGWHRFYFKPVMLQKLKIIAEEVVPYDFWDGSRGVTIGEIELLDKEGHKIDAAVKNFNASSTLLISKPSMVMDNRLGHVWESRCSILADRTLSSKTLERLREGCYINKNVLTRAFMVHRYEYVKDKPELLERLHNEDFEPGKVVLLEEEPNEYNIQEGPYNDSVEIAKYKLNSIEILIENDKPGFLVLSDMYAPGWEVYVNGKKEKLLIANGLFRGVYIKGKKNRVVFKYIPPLLKLGLAISFISLFIIIGIVIKIR